MPVNMDFVHPIIQAFLQASELGQQKRLKEQDQKLQAQHQAEQRRQFDESKRLQEEQFKREHDLKVAAAKTEHMQQRALMGKIYGDLIEKGILPPGTKTLPVSNEGANFNEKLRQGNFGQLYQHGITMPGLEGFTPPVTGGGTFEEAQPPTPNLVEPEQWNFPSPETIGANKMAIEAPLLMAKKAADEQAQRNIELLRQGGRLDVAALTAKEAAERQAKDIASRETEGRLNREAALARAKLRQNQNGLDSRTNTRIDSWLKAHDANPQTKRYVLTKEAVSFVNALPNDTTSPADDQGLIYAFAKAMDPESVVREGEYATVQKYSQSWAERFKFSAQRVLDNTEFLTPQAREMMKNTIRTKSSAIGKEYQGYRNNIAKRIDELAGQGEGNRLLGDYLDPASNKRKLTPEEQFKLGRHKDPVTGYWVDNKD